MILKNVLSVVYCILLLIYVSVDLDCNDNEHNAAESCDF